MGWVQFYKVNQDVITSYVEGTGSRDLFPKHLGYPSLSYKYVDGATFFGEKELEKFKKHVTKNLVSEAERAMKELVRTSDNFVGYSKTIYGKDLSKYGSKELAEEFLKFVESFKGLVGLAPLPVCFDPIVETELEKEIGKIFDSKEKKEEHENALRILLDLREETFGAKEKRLLLEIAVEIEGNAEVKKLFEKGNVKEIKKALESNAKVFARIKKHLGAWAWIKIHILEGNPFSLEDILERIKKMLEEGAEKELKQIVENKKKANKNFAQFVGQYSCLKDLAETAQCIMLVRDYRFALVCKGAFYSRPLAKEIAKRLGTDYLDILYLLPYETVSALKSGRIDRELIAGRRKAYAFFVEGQSERILSGKDFKRLLVLERKEVAAVDHFDGIIACKGLVKGKVRIVQNVSELKKVGKGDILVCQQTIPDFVPAMEKAAAIVTDLGGITSHAAIISRELGIPCIVGTKIATKVLKENDFVEVDADKGVVRKLK